jgi:hypothetical protein
MKIILKNGKELEFNNKLKDKAIKATSLLFMGAAKKMNPDVSLDRREALLAEAEKLQTKAFEKAAQAAKLAQEAGE